MEYCHIRTIVKIGCELQEASNQISSQSYHHCAMKSPSGLDDVAPLDEDCDDTENSMKECSESQAQVYPAQLPLGVSSAGTVFRLHYLGSVEVEEEGGRKRRKRLKKNMVEEAVIKIKVCFCHFNLIVCMLCSVLHSLSVTC